MTDAETTAAIEALTYRVKLRDEAIREGRDYPDAEPFALKFLTKLRGQGWRPTEARAKPEPHEPGAGTPQSPEVAELLATARADMEARAAAARAAKESAA